MLVALGSPEDRAFNVMAELGPGVQALIGSEVSWLTPVETEKTARRLGDRTHAVAISSPWTTGGLISPIVAGKGGLEIERIIGGEPRLLDSAIGQGPVPSEREGARGLLTLSERSLLLVGGQRPNGQPTGEIWRYLLDAQSWQPLFWRQHTRPAEVLAAAYDPERRRLVVIDEKERLENAARLYDSTVPGGYVDEGPDIGPGTRRRLLLFDSDTGEVRVLRTCPRSKKVSRVALVARGDGSFLQVAFRASHHDWTAWRLTLDDDGEPVYDGKLKGDGDYLDDPVSTDAGVVLPLLDGGVQRLLTITDAMLGSGSAACNAF